ncbi:lipoate--protein ligase family protein [Cryobacterium sp. Y62]|uniref:lipoyl protein ligase domain-containing protein n=1 Tax=Cryobacterium sp. Y62 TaxID=2048284 RepID=UPI0011B00450|nr:lipoate--protein ligase family protein [Cryobacterium sp. Y62]
MRVMTEANQPVPARMPKLSLGRIGSTAQEDIDESLRALREMQLDVNAHARIRAYRPLPTVAFSRRESLMPEFAEASAAARSFGFDPVIRLAGGRAVAYDQTCLIIDLMAPLEFYNNHIAAFEAGAGCFRDVLGDLGLDARVGPVVGEYCAGDHSVNARGQVKVVGIAQRAMRRARLLTACIVLETPERLRPVVDAVYGAMKLEWSPASLGSVRGEGAQGTLDEIVRELVSGLQQRHAEWAFPHLTQIDDAGT